MSLQQNNGQTSYSKTTTKTTSTGKIITQKFNVSTRQNQQQLNRIAKLNTKEEEFQPKIIKKIRPPSNNFAYLEGNQNIYKEKGETVETTYVGRKGKFTTIVKSPEVPKETFKKIQVTGAKNMQFYDSNTGRVENRGTTQTRTVIVPA